MIPIRMEIRTACGPEYRKIRRNILPRIEIRAWEDVTIGIIPLMNSIVDSVDVNFLLIKVKDD